LGLPLLIRCLRVIPALLSLTLVGQASVDFE
jgi:hypothetical protein